MPRRRFQEKFADFLAGAVQSSVVFLKRFGDRTFRKAVAVKIFKMFFTAAVVFLFCDFVIGRLTSRTRIDCAERAVRLLYDYGTVEQLESQQEQLKKIVTSDVYNQLTVDNEERRLNTYLKFGEDAVTVKIVGATSDYIVYSLDCMTIDPSRKFIFRYWLGGSGKIVRVVESELIDFMDDAGTASY